MMVGRFVHPSSLKIRIAVVLLRMQEETSQSGGIIA